MLPETLHADGYRVHMVLVDVAPLEELGSRQEEKLVLSAEEFSAEAEERVAG